MIADVKVYYIYALSYGTVSREGTLLENCQNLLHFGMRHYTAMDWLQRHVNTEVGCQCLGLKGCSEGQNGTKKHTDTMLKPMGIAENIATPQNYCIHSEKG